MLWEYYFRGDTNLQFWAAHNSKQGIITVTDFRIFRSELPLLLPKATPTSMIRN